MVWVLVGVRGCVAVDAGHDLATLLSLPGRLRTDRCISHRGKSQTYYPEHILWYGHLEDLLPSCRGFGSFWTDCLGGFWDRRSLHSTESGTQGWGLGVLVWMGT